MITYSVLSGSNTEVCQRILMVCADSLKKEGLDVLDATWGEGGFWRTLDGSPHKVWAADLLEDVVKAKEHPFVQEAVQCSARELSEHFGKAAFDVVILDPPFHSSSQKVDIEGKARKLALGEKANEIRYAKAYSNKERYQTKNPLSIFYPSQVCTILRPGGFFLLKIMDNSDGWWHFKAYEHLQWTGFGLRWMFIHDFTWGGTRPLPTMGRNEGVRPAHAYWMVFQKAT